MPRRPVQKRRDLGRAAYHRSQAQAHFTRAAAALTEIPMLDNLTFALFEGALGMMELAKSDPGQVVLDRLEGVLRTVRDERGEIPTDEGETSMKTTTFATFTFEGAHRLPHVPEGHKCGRLHGHNWTVEIQCSGPVKEPEGWIIDFYAIETAWRPLYELLDHRLLNDVDGLANPTTEKIVEWIYRRMKMAIPEVSRVTVRETPTFGASYSE